MAKSKFNTGQFLTNFFSDLQTGGIQKAFTNHMPPQHLPSLIKKANEGNKKAIKTCKEIDAIKTHV